jgi:hypothetical protein
LSRSILTQCLVCKNISRLEIDEQNWCCRICADRSEGFQRFLDWMKNPLEYPREILLAKLRLPTDDPYAIEKALGGIAAADEQRAALAAAKDQQALLAANAAKIDLEPVLAPDQNAQARQQKQSARDVTREYENIRNNSKAHPTMDLTLVMYAVGADNKMEVQRLVDEGHIKRLRRDTYQTDSVMRFLTHGKPKKSRLKVTPGNAG